MAENTDEVKVENQAADVKAAEQTTTADAVTEEPTENVGAATGEENAKQTTEKKTEKKYSRRQFLKDERYIGYTDLVNALMGEDERLTAKELDKRISKFLNKKL